MSSSTKTSLAIKRLKGFAKVFTRSKMAVVGIIILATFSTIALTAPLITHNDPWQNLVSGETASPVWFTYFPEGSRLSQNLFPIKNPTFSEASSIAEWKIANDHPERASVGYTGLVGTTADPTPGSIYVTYSRQEADSPETVHVRIENVFHYSYTGPPKRFRADLSVNVVGATTDSPVAAKLFLYRTDLPCATAEDHCYLWSDDNGALFTGGTGWKGAPYPLDSNLNGPLTDELRVSALDLGAAAKAIFSQAGDYTYGIEFTIRDSGKDLTHQVFVYLDDFNIKLYGTAFGVLGTDHLGRDLFAWLIYGTRISIIIGLSTALIGIGLGLVVGLLAGYIGGLFDEIAMRFTDMILVIPTLPLILVLIAVFGSNIRNLILVIGLLGWPGFARIVRSQVLSLKERPFVEAAKAAGAGTRHITVRHIFPNIVSLAYVNLALFVPAAIITEAALAWLGLGDPNVISWGNILYYAEIYNAQYQWWWTVPPGLAIASMSLSFVLIGYALDEVFNPKLRRRR